MAEETTDEGTLSSATPRPAPKAESPVPPVAADPTPKVEPVGSAVHAAKQAQDTPLDNKAARRARKRVTPAVADATPSDATPPMPVVPPAVAAPLAAQAVAPAPAAKPIAPPQAAPVPAGVSKPLAAGVAKPAPVRANAARPLQVKKALAGKAVAGKGSAKAVSAKPAPATPVPTAKTKPEAAQPETAKPETAKPEAAQPAVTTRPGTGIPHAKVPAPLKTRVTHAAAAASRKEHSIMTTATEFSEKFQSAFKDASEKAKAAFEKSQAAFGDAGEFAKGNVEAVVESSKILASGLQELTKDYAAEGKSAIETFTAEIKELASAKSPTEFFEKHTALVRKQFDAAVAASSKHSEAVLKLANEAFQPISNRVSLAVEKLKVAA